MPASDTLPDDLAFAAFDLGEDLLDGVRDAGFEAPRRIQALTIPKALDGQDVLGLAQTGTGKTAAFALPMMERLLAGRSRQPRGLVLVPTRELAVQIQADIQLLGRHTDIRAVTVFGGVSPAAQINALKKGPDIVVACPGRLLDLVGAGHARLDQIEIAVLDEADHMLDMGFLPDIKRILSLLPDDRQNLLFSATMPAEIRRLADRVLDRPHVVELEHSAPAATVEHTLYPVAPSRKAPLLKHLMESEKIESAIVFLRTKHRARRLARDLDAAGHRAVALQGNMNQRQRQRAMQGFRDGEYDVLVATEIAARGIDVPNVSHVINFDVPDTPEAYTHRIGRTGRAERKGKAFTFAGHEEFDAIKDIERALKIELPRVKLKQFGGDSGGRPSEEARPGGPKQGPGGRAPKVPAKRRKRAAKAGRKGGPGKGGQGSSSRGPSSGSRSSGRRRSGGGRPGRARSSRLGASSRGAFR